MTMNKLTDEYIQGVLVCLDYYDDVMSMASELLELRKDNDKHEKEIIELITERDYWEGKATELAEDVGELLDFEVGEHSSANCPVRNAIDNVGYLYGLKNNNI